MAEVEHSAGNSMCVCSFPRRQLAIGKNTYKIEISVDSEGFKGHWHNERSILMCVRYISSSEKGTQKAHTCCDQLMYRTRIWSACVNTTT